MTFASDRFSSKSADKFSDSFADEEMASGLMIQCDTCKCWQHGACVGLWDEKVRRPACSLPQSRTRERDDAAPVALCFVTHRTLTPPSLQECPNRYFCELCKPSLHGPGG
jgi:hypothetical protein